MKFYNVKSQTEVLDILKNLASKYKLQMENIKTIDSLNRVTSSPTLSKMNIPEYNRSTVDGYGIVSAQSHGATDSIPSLMELKGSVDMGKITNIRVKNNEAVYVPTGGMVPLGADGVIMIEYCEEIDNETIGLMSPISVGENIILTGDDIKLGDVALGKQKKISSLDIGVLSSLGLSSVEVYKKPTITIISTGDEIVEIDREKNDGEIFDINGNVISSLAFESGAYVTKKLIVKDNYKDLYEAVDRATAEADIVLISGGSSVGTRDFTYDVINNIEDSKIYVEGIAIKPGKPTIIGTGKGKLIMGLPGHPVSSIIVYKIFVDYYIKKLLGQKPVEFDFTGRVTSNIHSAPGKTTYQLVNVDRDGFDIKISPIYGKSGMISVLANAQGYIVIEDHLEGINKGEMVKGYYFG